MKKSLLALAVLGTFAGLASAQSSVTLFGIVDLGLRNVKNGSVDQKQMAGGALNSNRIGVRGIEDLGGGMRAGFWIEGDMTPDNGTAGGLTWQRRSTVSLMGNWGEIRLGRDYTPSFWNTTIFDPFGLVGVGSFGNLSINALGTGAATYVRADNSVGYFLPGNLGGFYGQVQTSAGEGIDANKQTSARVGFAAGPVNVAVSFGSTDTSPNKYKHNNVAGSYDFGFLNLMAQYDIVEAGSVDQKTWELGAVVPVGQGEFKAAYTNAERDNPTGADPEAKQIAVGYVYNLSKRTAMYGTYSQIKNKNAAAFTVGAGPGSSLNAKSTGYEVGLRHSF